MIRGILLPMILVSGLFFLIVQKSLFASIPLFGACGVLLWVVFVKLEPKLPKIPS